MSLKVGLNGACFTNTPSGANQRFLGIYGQLASKNPDIGFTVFSLPGSTLPQQFQSLNNVEFVQAPISGGSRLIRHLQGLTYWQKQFEKKPLHIFEQFHLPLIKAPRSTTILTIHDIRAVVSKSNPFERGVGRLVFSKAIREADHVITVSNAMKSQILNFFPKAKVSVVYNGFEQKIAPSIVEQQSFKSKYGLPNEFLLSVGHLESRKNHKSLIKALSILKERGDSLYLVIVGNDGGQGKILANLISSLQLTSQVKILSGLSHSELFCAYAACQLFVFPSTYEGFGIPILESMAAGTPMILSDIPVFREITENQSVYFEPENNGELAEKITKTLGAKSEQDRMVRYGKNRIKQFDFSTLAEQITTLYKRLGHPLP